MTERTLPQATPPAPTGTQAATPDQLKRSAELSANPAGDAAPKALSERYELRDQLARGGMGSVHAAWDNTFDRAVAVKLIHDHLLGEDTIKRFRHEARIAGQLQHPNIPPVYDLGYFDGNKPYLAMKLVKGRTLDDHIKHPGGDTPNLVAVFESIAQAIGYAHSRGVIHRDLKPQNVMVGAFGEVQVMDWGLAKTQSNERSRPSEGHESSEPMEPTVDPDATTGYGTRIGAPDTATDSRTSAGSILGTPAYMPPEQARGDLEQITERSDVFGLGAILCSILTGQSVFGGGSAEQARQKAAAGDVADAFVRLDASAAEPELIGLAKRCLAPDPADRLANGTEVANETARIRAESEARAKQAELDRVRVQGDLAKAEAEARAQRKRRQVLSWSAALVTLVLIGGIVGTALGLREAKVQEENAKNEAIAKGYAKDKAETNLAFAKKGNEILGSVFERINPKSDFATIGELTQALRENLAYAEKELNGTALGEPLEVADMQNTLGKSILKLGEPARAIKLFEMSRATRDSLLGPDHPLSLASLTNLGVGYLENGQPEKALPLLEDAYRKMKEVSGTDHDDTSTCMGVLAGAYRDMGNMDLAMPLLEENLRLQKLRKGEEHIDTIKCYSQLASGYSQLGRWKDAIPIYKKVLAMRKNRLGPKHPDTIDGMNNLAVAFWDYGRFDEALPLYEESYSLLKSRHGPEHPSTITGMENLALCHQSAGHVEKAIPLLRESLALRTARLGPDHPETLLSMNNLGLALRDGRQLENAIALFESARALSNTKLGHDHPDTINTITNLAQCYRDIGRIDDAMMIFEVSYKLRLERFGPDHPMTLVSQVSLASGYHTKNVRKI